jgi:hypothetical protein
MAITPKAGRVSFDEAAKDPLSDYRTRRKRPLDDDEGRIEST